MCSRRACHRWSRGWRRPRPRARRSASTTPRSPSACSRAAPSPAGYSRMRTAPRCSWPARVSWRYGCSSPSVTGAGRNVVDGCRSPRRRQAELNSNGGNMASVNKVILVGNLGRDPEVRYSPNGGAICNITVATSRMRKDKDTGERREDTEWHRVVLFDRLGEIANEYLRKGRSVYIEGRLQTRKWQD